MSAVSDLEERLGHVEQHARLRVVEGLLESTVLKERREWLASLDLVHYLLAVFRDQLRGLLTNPPEDAAAGVKHWMHGLQLGCLNSLKETAFAHRSRRIYHLGLIDQWEPTVQLLDQAVDDVYVELSQAKALEARAAKRREREQKEKEAAGS